jgi:hypothetical protein
MNILPALGLLVSQAVNALCFGGDADESLSARCHRERWPNGERRIDAVLGKGHCARVWSAHVSRIHARVFASPF